jgi:RNA polymerase sigma-70 factor (ECF subfamily)
MPKFEYDPAIGSFKAWLLIKTRWCIIDQLRKRGPLAANRSISHDTATGTSTAERIADPASHDLDAVWEAEWEKNLLDAAMDRVKRRLDPEKYQIFDFYVNKQWAPEKVAARFGISTDLVYVSKHRVIKLIKEEVERLEKEVT